MRAAVRRPDLAGHLQPMGAVGQIQPVQANLRYPDRVRRAVEGADAVVNLVGILAKSGAQTFHAVHVAGARAVAKAARAAGAKTMVHVSALGADAREIQLRAHQGGRRGGRAARSFPGAVILRPSLVFGPEDQLFNRFAAMARLLAVPAADRRRPHQAAAGLRRRRGSGDRRRLRRQGASPGQSTSWAGPRSSPSASCSTDPGVVGPQAPLSAHPLLGGQARRAADPAAAQRPAAAHRRPGAHAAARNVVSEAAQAEGRTLAGLGIEHPHTMEAVVPGYLERFQPHGQFAHYRG